MSKKPKIEQIVTAPDDTEARRRAAEERARGRARSKRGVAANLLAGSFAKGPSASSSLGAGGILG